MKKQKIMLVVMCLFTIVILTACSNDVKNATKDGVATNHQEKNINNNMDSESANVDKRVIEGDSKPVDEKQDIQNNTYFGNWKISKIAGYSPIYVDTDESANIGKAALYTAEIARFNDNERKNPIYKEMKYSKSKFFEENRIQLSDIGINDEQVRIVEIEDWSGPGSGFIIKNEQALILLWDGIYYELNKE
ncbi:hypothetical protein [Paenibacillus assamensis]|uniref:hypothetical protein n=1 Tax=Paenibacillus assamensis TaxID=311244 RepID=UPI0004195995|nr:hypothetical protein [Paenibacillus assamensis]